MRFKKESEMEDDEVMMERDDAVRIAMELASDKLIRIPCGELDAYVYFDVVRPTPAEERGYEVKLEGTVIFVQPKREGEVR